MSQPTKRALGSDGCRSRIWAATSWLKTGLTTCHLQGIAAVFVTVMVAASTLHGAQSGLGLKALVGRRTPAVVKSIVDGDTIHVALTDGTDLTVRLDGIDTPEKGEPFSNEATKATRVLLLGQQALLVGTDVDRYGRLVARVFVGSTDSSIELVRSGLACHFTKYSSDVSLANSELDAKRRGVGFWATGASKPACVAKRLPEAAMRPRAGPFHGNTSSHVYHSSRCRNYNCKNCTAVFRTAGDAEAAGFKAAGDCLH